MKKGMYLAPIASLVVGIVLAGKPDVLTNWVHSHLAGGEKVVCQQEVGNDLFFVAVGGGKVKTGYRLDVTGKAGVPKTFIISWRFQDEKGNYIGAKAQPEVLNGGYRRLESEMYAEEVAYQPVYLSEVGVLDVTIALKKYDKKEDAPTGATAADNELEKVVQCSAPINQ